MRTIPAAMQTLWSNGGPLIGDDGAANGYVTVEPDWFLNLTSSTVGSFTRGPYRWWQRADNSQIEVIVPNIQSVECNRSLDADAATATIVLGNQWHYTNGQVSIDTTTLGQPGYFTPFRGDSAESQARWGFTQNDWNNVLVPNALIRTYEGYGGKSLSLADALTAGNVVLTGVWLVDELTLTTDGKINLACRDMCKLLIDQQLFPTLIPQNLYPLTYSRWAFRQYKGIHLTPMVPATFLGEATTPVVVAGCTDYGGTWFELDHSDDVRNLPGNGYWILVNNGNVYNFGNNVNYGNAAADWVNNPAQDIVATPTGLGYYVLRRDGNVQVFGDAVHQGEVIADASITTPPAVWHNGSQNSIAVTPSGAGYWTVQWDGVVHAFGDAVGAGNHTPINLLYPNWEESDVCVDIESCPTGGYYTLGSHGQVVAHGGAPDYGNPYPSIDGDGNIINVFVKMGVRPQGDGYWVMDQSGDVHAFGTAPFEGQLPGGLFQVPTEGMAVNWPLESFPEFACDIIPVPVDTEARGGAGYWIIGVTGGVYPLGFQPDGTLLESLGDLAHDYTAQLREDGNYLDYVDIIKELLLWSGWYLYDPAGGDPVVFSGGIESTGAFAEDPLPDDLFDKKPVIDAINSIKEVVGYIFFIDETGAACFHLPNIWTPGNFLDGAPTDFIPDIDESLQLTAYTLKHNDTTARSEIIISTNDPTVDQSDTITTKYVPSNADLLRGMVKPAMWINAIFTSPADQETMAELIALYSFLAQRQGQLTCLALPSLQMDDQVRIWERQSSETYIHYVRGISTSHDFNSGVYTMTITTHWMGDGTNTPPTGTGGGGTGGTGGGGSSSDLVNTVLNDGPEGYWILDETAP